MVRLQPKSNLTWYIEALCQGLTIGFSEVLIIIWYSRQEISAINLGIMFTLPMAIGAIIQSIATKQGTQQKNPQRLASLSIACQVLGLALMAFSLTLTAYSEVFLFLGQCLYWIGGMTASSPTQDILAKSVPREQHNRFFSRRAIVITLVTLVCNFVSASFLDRGLTASILVQFIMIAAAARLISLMMINGHQAPLVLRRLDLSEAEDNKSDAVISILKLSICMFLFRLAANISSPFYSAFMLKDLQMTISLYSVVTAIPLITKTFCLTNWARLLDDNRKFEGLFLATLGIACVPLFWAFDHSLPAILGFQALSGLSWSGFDLISILLIQHMFPRSVTHKLGLFLALGSLGSVAGGIIGGYILNRYGSYPLIFGISGVARLATGFVLLWYLRQNHLFRFHKLNLKHGLSTIVAVRPSLEAAAKLLPLPGRRAGKRDNAA